MPRSLALLTFCLSAVLVGCAGPARQTTASDSAAQDPKTAVRELYGARLASVQRQPAGPGSLVVRLREGRPGDRDPFILLAAISEAASLPASYELQFERGDSASGAQSIYVWDPVAQTITWEDRDFDGSMGTAFYRGMLSDVETETIAAIASGNEEIPEWERWRNAEPRYRQTVDARGSVGKSLQLTVTIASEQLVAGSDQLGVVALENLSEKSRTIEYPSMGIRITDRSGTLVADYPAPRPNYPGSMPVKFSPYERHQTLIRFTAPEEGSYLLYGYADDYQTEPISLVTTDVESIVDEVGIVRPIPGTEDGSAP